MLVLASAVIGGLLTLAGEGDTRIVGGFVIAIAVGSMAYSSVFVLLSLVTSRALFVGLAYAFIWEAVITNFAPGVQRFSIREFTASIAEAAADTSPWVFEADLGTHLLGDPGGGRDGGGGGAGGGAAGSAFELSDAP